MTSKQQELKPPLRLRRQALTATAAIFGGILVSFLAAHAVQGHLRECIERAVRIDIRQPIEVAEIATKADSCAGLWRTFATDPEIPSGLPLVVVDQRQAIDQLESCIDAFLSGAQRPSDRDSARRWKQACQTCREILDRLADTNRLMPVNLTQRSIAGYVEQMRDIAEGARRIEEEDLRLAEENRKNLQLSIGRISWLIDLRGVAPLGVVGLWSLWFFYHSLRRILVLSAAVRLLSGGRFDVRIPIEGDDELAQVARQFNEMAAVAEASRQKIEEEIKQHRLTSLQLTEATEAAQAASRAKSEFLANMSHELRTPLTAILGFTDVLVENLEKPDNIQAAQTIKRNGEYLLEIINDILDLSKIEAGRLQVEKVVCSPVEIIADVASLMRVRADEKKLPVHVEYQGAIPRLVATDPTRLRQILINLVGNAIKFTQQGWIKIVVQCLKTTDEHVTLAFDVIDTGIGMTEAVVGKLFRPFTQADSSTTRKFGGTGLGLTISKRLAELLGGTVTVTSRPRHGSTFRLTIQCSQVTEELLDRPEESVSNPQLAIDATGKDSIKIDCHVLLAEDGPDNRRLISYLLAQVGAEVETAENGYEAMELALSAIPERAQRLDGARSPFDLILMDMQMPVMDGYEATRRLRENAYRGPIIALTAHAMSHDRQKCLDAGCDDYLAKPIDKRHLFEIVSRYARTKPAERGAHQPGESQPEHGASI